MFEMVAELAAAGFCVTFCAVDRTRDTAPALRELGALVVDESPDDHLANASTVYDCVVISRPYNYADFGGEVRRYQPQAILLYDAEALWHRRAESQIRSRGFRGDVAELQTLASEMRAIERFIFRDCDEVVCISRDEASIALSTPGHAPVTVIEPFRYHGRRDVPGYEGREDVIFVAEWIAGSDSPNADGLRWFAETVFPRVVQQQSCARLLVTGDCSPLELGLPQGRNIHYTGRVPDLAPILDTARVAVVPLRYGAGVKMKTVKAIENAVPVVSTTAGAEGLQPDVAEAIRVSDDAEEFASAVIELLRSPRAWQHAQRKLKALFTVDNAPRSWAAHVEALLEARADMALSAYRLDSEHGSPQRGEAVGSTSTGT
jgi:hypothetical protein